MVKFIKSKKTGEYIKIDPDDKDSLKYVTQYVTTFTEYELRKERDVIIRAIGSPLTLEDKINAIESFSHRHYAPYQWVEHGLLEYFAMLRCGENIEFLKDLHTYTDLMEYSYIVRDTHRKKVRE